MMSENNESYVIENGIIKQYSNYFKIFFTASIVYALISAILIYNNVNGIGKTIFTIATCAYSIYCLKKSNVRIKTGSKVLMVFAVLLGISIVNTSDEFVILINEILIFVSIIISIMHSYVSDSDWQLVEYIKGFLCTVIEPIFSIDRISPRGEVNYQERYYGYRGNDVEEVRTFKTLHIFIGLAISFCLLIVILPLLFSADQIFELLVTNILASIKINTADLIVIVILFVILFLVSFCTFKYLNLGNLESIKINRSGKVNDLIGATMLTVLSIVYVAFSFVQVFGLFLNKLQLPEGETFSSYARTGFFQLLYVALINLIVIVISFYLFNRSKVIKILLTVISISTYIMLVSSIYRLMLYIGVYHLTKLRLYALWGLIVVFVGLTGAVISIYNERFKLVRYGFMALLVLWTAFSFMRPEYVIAKYNLTRNANEKEELGYIKVDLGYITSFSSDASSPIYEYIVKNPNDRIVSYYTHYSNYSKGEDNFGLKFNFSKWNYNKHKKMLKNTLPKA